MRAISNNGSIGGRATGTRLAVRATVHVAPSEPQHVTHKPASFINAKVNYIQPSAHGEELYAYLYEKPESVSKVTNLEHVEIEVPMTDLRTIEDKKGRFTLHDNGFQLEQLHVPSDIDWTNNAEVGSASPSCFEGCLQLPHVAHRPYYVRRICMQSTIGQPMLHLMIMQLGAIGFAAPAF